VKREEIEKKRSKYNLIKNNNYLALLETTTMKNNTKAQKTGGTVGALEIFARDHCFHRVIVLALAFVGGATSLGIAKTAQADNLPLYSTSFEQPTFQAGDQLLGLDGWSTAIPPFLNPPAAKITRDAASNRKQSVVVLGGDLIGSAGITAPYDAVGSYRRPLGQEISANQSRIHVDADLLLETNQPATPGEFFSLTIAARSGDGETLGEIGLSSQGIVEAFEFNVDPGSPPTPDLIEPILFNHWYHITMLLDYENRTTSYYIDGHLLGTVDAPSSSNVLSRAAMVVYARPDGGIAGGASSARSNYTARFDNFRVRVNSAHDKGG
jgi:hypothetical protein